MNPNTQSSLRKTDEVVVKKTIREFNQLIKLEEWNQPTYGDGHYCMHHPDDPCHGDKCYEHECSKWLRDTLTTIINQVRHEEREKVIADILDIAVSPRKDAGWSVAVSLIHHYAERNGIKIIQSNKE